MEVYTISSHFIPLCSNNIKPRFLCQAKCEIFLNGGCNKQRGGRSPLHNAGVMRSGQRYQEIINEARLAESHGERNDCGACHAASLPASSSSITITMKFIDLFQISE